MDLNNGVGAAALCWGAAGGLIFVRYLVPIWWSRLVVRVKESWRLDAKRDWERRHGR